MDYFLAYKDENMVIKRAEDSLLYKYDEVKKQWISDAELYRVYFGDLPVKVITKEEALVRTDGHA